MLHPEYIKDMQSSYLLLKGMEGSSVGYGSKMLLYNQIPGLLRVEIRRFDELSVNYYDISGKRSILDNYDKVSLKLEDIKHIITSVINILGGSLEYLLYENDFIIEPGYVFIDPDTNQIFLCHLVGYQMNVQTQISSFIEYLMNKVDYKDEKAVLLVYSLYKGSREVNCTYEKLLSELNKSFGEDKEIRIDDKEQRESISNPYNSNSKGVMKDEKSNYESIKKEKDKKGNITRKVPLRELLRSEVSRKEAPRKEPPRKEGQGKTEGTIKTTTDLSYKHLLPEAIGEEETMCYSNKTYLLAILSISLSGILFIIALMLGLLHNTFKTQLDPIKVICFLVILGSIEVYLLCKLFQDSNKITKMVSTIKYESNDQYESNDFFIEIDKEVSKDNICNKEISSGDLEDNDMTVNLYGGEEKEIISDVTEALSYFEPKLLLKPLDKDNYKYINLSRFPFLVGKNQKVVNHCFNNNTISRIHSRFEKSGDEIYLVDLNSLNGTFINGDRLDRNQPYKISQGDKISFANLNYIFQVE
jgi:hypothetical protein